MKVVIVGGVAAGASAAARLRRLDEHAEILLLERGSAISYANCGLPYHLGQVIPDRDDLLVMSPERFASWLNVQVKTDAEVIAIDRQAKTVAVQTASGVTQESYDKLLLATGALPNGGTQESAQIMPLWTIRDMDKVAARLAGAHRAVIVGAGFIGLEVAENLRHRGLEVAVVQRGAHVLPTIDEEMAAPLADELIQLGIELKLSTTVAAYEEREDGVAVQLSDGSTLNADLVIESIGVKPNSKLAQDAGLACGARGHILVDEFLQTSDPDIFAAGDAIEVVDPVFGGKTAIPLAGPANKQGRIVAANLLGKRIAYPGTIGASVVKVGSLTAASVGYTEAKLKAAKQPFRKIYLHPVSHAGYYPGAGKLDMKLLFGDDGTIYGAQIVGAEGVDKRIDTIAQAMQNHLKAPQLGALELAYAPPYSSAKDPVNFAGFIAENVLSGLSDVVYPDTVPADALVLDVREPEENALGAIPNAVNIRLGDLRQRLGELDKNKLIVTCCQVGLRGYLAERILKQNGFRAANLSGGWLTWKMFHHELPKIEKAPETPQPAAVPPAKSLNVQSLPCPGPVLKLKAAVAEMAEGESLHLIAAKTFEPDLLRWANGANCSVTNLQHSGNALEAVVTKGAALTPCALNAKTGGDSISIVLFSNDLDKALAALILANGFAASGTKVNIFFTFWGLSVLRKDPPPQVEKTLMGKLFGWMLPCGAKKLALSKMHMLGMGTAMMKEVMKQQNVLSLPELLQSARAAGVRFIACDMAMGVMGVTRDELIDVDEVAGVATFAELAKQGSNALFI